MNIRFFSLQEKNNKEVAESIERKLGIKLINSEIFKGENNGHKFKVGQNAILVGLKDYPQHNGKTITISSIRQDGKFGKAYYFLSEDEELCCDLNWTYEYRLKAI